MGIFVIELMFLLQIYVISCCSNGFDIYWPDAAWILVLIWWVLVVMGVN